MELYRIPSTRVPTVRATVVTCRVVPGMTLLDGPNTKPKVPRGASTPFRRGAARNVNCTIHFVNSDLHLTVHRYLTAHIRRLLTISTATYDSQRAAVVFRGPADSTERKLGRFCYGNDSQVFPLIHFDAARRSRPQKLPHRETGDP